jgi:hypothetical protein
MLSSETSMPHSTIRHRPIFATPQVTPLVLRASTLSLTSVLHPGEERKQGRVPWHIAFCLGMMITLVILLFGHFVR